MSYRIEITASADKYLAKLARAQPKDAEAIEDAIEDLAGQPRPAGCKALTGYRGVLRIRVGSYRICYTVDDGKLLVLVITVSTRDEVYRLVRKHLGR